MQSKRRRVGQRKEEERGRVRDVGTDKLREEGGVRETGTVSEKGGERKRKRERQNDMFK